MTEWPMVPLRELSDNERGITYGIVQPGKPTTDGIPILRADDIDNGRITTSHLMRVRPEVEAPYRRSRLRGGEVLLTLVGAYFGKAAVVREEHVGLNTARAVGVIPVRESADFICYALRSPACQSFMQERATTTAQPTLNLRDVGQILIPWPSRQTRDRLTNILRTLDEKIELNRRMNETLQAMARTIFKSWFVDFDPVRAKAEGRDHELPEHIADLFPDSFEDSELGEIPAGWEVSKIEKFATLSRDSINPGEFPDETFEHFSIPAFDEGQTPKRELGGSIKSNKFLIPSDAILLSKLNPRIPRLWLPVVRDTPRAICSTEFLVVLPRIDAFRQFICGLLSSEAFSDLFETLVTGTSGSHQRVRPEGLLSMNIVIPENSVIRHFSKVVQPLLARMDCARNESQTLAAFREALLPKLVSGELRVKRAGSLITGSLSASTGVGG